MHNVNVLNMRKFDSTREKEETWPFLSQRNLNILQHILLHCRPSPPRSIDGNFLAILKSLVALYVIRPPY